MADRGRPESARRTEGEGVPPQSAVTPGIGSTEAEREREDEAPEKAEPQRRRKPKTEPR